MTTENDLYDEAIRYALEQVLRLKVMAWTCPNSITKERLDRLIEERMPEERSKFIQELNEELDREPPPGTTVDDDPDSPLVLWNEEGF